MVSMYPPSFIKGSQERREMLQWWADYLDKLKGEPK